MVRWGGLCIIKVLLEEWLNLWLVFVAIGVAIGVVCVEKVYCGVCGIS